LDKIFRAISTKKGSLIAALIIICLGAALRIAFLGSLPFGLNQDEASAGYEAWSILNYGIDRHGYSLPVLFKAWGSGQNVLYSYLSMPFIAIFGLSPFSIRLLSSLAGIATLPIFWLFARETRGGMFSLAALLVLAVNPWHIMVSRWSLESNLLPFFLILGVYFMALSLRRPSAIIPAAVSFALSLYAYGTAFIFLAMFLVFGVFWLIRYNAVRLPYFLPAFALFILIALPITVCQINNVTGVTDMTLWGLSLPKLTESRQAATTILGGGISSVTENYGAFLSMLWNQSDGLSFNALPFYGIFYFFGLPFVIIGFAASLANFRECRNEILLIAALLISLLCSFLIDPNINRMNMAWIPFIYFEAVGFYMLLKKMKKFFVVPIFFLLIFTALFADRYMYAMSSNPHYFPGLQQAVEYVESREAETVHVTNYVNQPYVFVLFYSEISPYDFISTVNYVNLGAAFEHVSGFGKYTFGSAAEVRASYMVLHNSEAAGFEVEKVFGDYSVCAGRK
jgi:4-amino-4-deoxy-L-arabinose transferase and related glycosyltransferases of PMT family